MSLIEQLRKGGECTAGCSPKVCICATAEDAADRIEKLERVMSCLLDHTLNCYEQNDGQEFSGMRDALCTEAEALVPNWRERMREWEPSK